MSDRRRVVVVADVVGAALLTLGWWVASRRVTVSDQIPWVDVSVTGVALAGFANAGWLFRRHQLVRRRARRLSLLGQTTLLRMPAEATGFVALPGVTRYHRPHCALVTGRAARAAARADHERLGRRPCGVCRP
jgi:hypothetical protein